MVTRINARSWSSNLKLKVSNLVYSHLTYIHTDVCDTDGLGGPDRVISLRNCDRAFLMKLGPLDIRRHFRNLWKRHPKRDTSSFIFTCDYSQTAPMPEDISVGHRTSMPFNAVLDMHTIDEVIAAAEAGYKNPPWTSKVTREGYLEQLSYLNGFSALGADGIRRGLPDRNTNCPCALFKLIAPNGATTYAKLPLLEFAKFYKFKAPTGSHPRKMPARTTDGRVLQSEWDEVDEILHRLRCRNHATPGTDDGIWWSTDLEGKRHHVFDVVDKIIEEVEAEYGKFYFLMVGKPE